MEQLPKLDPTTEIALRTLKDIATPTPVSWMPQTWGWLAVASFFLAIVLLWCARAYRRWKRNAYRREALKLLDEIEVDLRSPDARGQAVNRLTELVKRTALAAWPRKDVAAITGRDWIRFLRAHDTGGIGRALEIVFDDIEYQGERTVRNLTPDVVDNLARGVRRWIEEHHVSA